VQGVGVKVIIAKKWNIFLTCALLWWIFLVCRGVLEQDGGKHRKQQNLN